MTTVAIHQPNFLPHLAFFTKLVSCDHLVLLDTAQFPRHGYTNRVRMLFQASPDDEGAVVGERGRWFVADWATLPVPKSMPLQTEIRGVPVVAGGNWRRKLLARIEQAYGKCVGYPDLAPKIQAVFASEIPLLADLNITLLEVLCNELGIRVPMSRASALDTPRGSCTKESAPSFRLSELVQSLGGTTYLSGPSGRRYLEADVFSRVGIQLQFSPSVSLEYPQPVSPFVPGLSILDTMMRIGPQESSNLVFRASTKVR